MKDLGYEPHVCDRCGTYGNQFKLLTFAATVCTPCHDAIRGTVIPEAASQPEPSPELCPICLEVGEHKH